MKPYALYTICIYPKFIITPTTVHHQQHNTALQPFSLVYQIEIIYFKIRLNWKKQNFLKINRYTKHFGLRFQMSIRLSKQIFESEIIERKIQKQSVLRFEEMAFSFNYNLFSLSSTTTPRNCPSKQYLCACFKLSFRLKFISTNRMNF